jgi:uncharacterized protein YgbK (DUF1537 family)
MTVVTDARERIRASHLTTGGRIVVLDDDPTGSQSVHGVAVLTEADPGEIAAALRAPGSTCFVLTNTRSLPEADAVALNHRIARSLLRLDAPVEIVSRSDSTLRGHVIAEVRALDAARREVTGRGYDGVLLAPSYFEAGRFTAGDVHYADGVPVGETEFARDASFGYASSNLREFVAEKCGGTGRSWSSTRPATTTSRSSCSGCSTPRRRAARSCTGPGRRSCARWPGWSRRTR